MKLSYIVPIYGVECYLHKCIDSLLHQNYEDYEIILVDDGSPDNCPAICDDYAAKYDNIRVVHRDNGGLSAARNSGIAEAGGEYICFVDSDDYWEENVLGGLMAQVERDNLDVLRFDFHNVRIENSVYQIFEPNKIAHKVDASRDVTDGLTYLNTRMSWGCYAWQFIVKKSILLNDGCLFTEGILFEDTDWTPRMMLYAKRVAATDTVVYNYLMRSGSITQAISKEKKDRILNDTMRLIGVLDGLSKQVHNTLWFDKMIAQTVVTICGMAAERSYKEQQKILARIRQYQVMPLSIRGAYEPSINKIRLINISPWIYCNLLRVIRIIKK